MRGIGVKMRGMRVKMRGKRRGKTRSERIRGI